MSVVVQQRHRQLRHHLDPVDSAQTADLWWLVTRAHQYAAAAGITIDVVLHPHTYQRRTGLRVGRWWAGAAYTGPPGARRTVPLLYLNPQLLTTRGDAETVIAHEVMHARWPNYGHRPIAFERAQHLLDAVASMQ